MGANQNSIQRTIILSITMVGAGLHGTLDALIRMAIHFLFLLHFGFGVSMARLQKIIRCFFRLIMLFYY